MHFQTILWISGCLGRFQVLVHFRLEGVISDPGEEIDLFNVFKANEAKQPISKSLLGFYAIPGCSRVVSRSLRGVYEGFHRALWRC